MVFLLEAIAPSMAAEAVMGSGAPAQSVHEVPAQEVSDHQVSAQEVSDHEVSLAHEVSAKEVSDLVNLPKQAITCYISDCAEVMKWRKNTKTRPIKCWCGRLTMRGGMRFACSDCFTSICSECYDWWVP